MSTGARVEATRSKREPITWCDGCKSLLGGATRERIRHHVETTGHTAHFVIEDITTYKPMERQS